VSRTLSVNVTRHWS